MKKHFNLLSCFDRGNPAFTITNFSKIVQSYFTHVINFVFLLDLKFKAEFSQYTQEDLQKSGTNCNKTLPNKNKMHMVEELQCLLNVLLFCPLQFTVSSGCIRVLHGILLAFLHEKVHLGSITEGERDFMTTLLVKIILVLKSG